MVALLDILNRDSKDQTAVLTNQGARLNERYVSIVRWMVQRNILPEVIGESGRENGIIWNFDRLKANYEQRRKRFDKFYGEQFGFSNAKKGLLIDLMAQKIPVMARKVKVFTKHFLSEHVSVLNSTPSIRIMKRTSF